MARFFLNRNKQRLFKTTLSACSAIAYSPAATVRLRHLKLQTILRRLFYASVIALSQPTFADTRCDNKAATLESVEGVVEWTTTDDHWQPAARGETFCYGDKIRVLEQRAALRLANDTIVRLRENSVVTLLPEDKGFWVELLQGAGHFLSRTPKQLTIKAAYLNAAIDGTEFVVAVEDQRNRVAVFEGDVRVFNRYGEVRLGEGSETSATANTAPNPARSIRLRDAAEWILYYPPLIIQNQAETAISALMDQERYGDALDALTQQNMTPENATLAASLALISGQPSEADRLLSAALQQNPQAPDALALQALKTLTDGDDQTALSQTTVLSQTHPQNVSVLLAHAYALQSQGEIEEALEINRQALSLAPDNLFILARTAELELSAGNTSAARKLIDRALQKAPNHSRVNTLAGFIALNRFANKEAQTYFRTAINSNDSEPLARLGLALALIQKGKIEEGRAEMEMAVLLDPGSSLLRSYLGKTYAAQNQNDWADTQYQLAKNLDPNDPTPWFYQAHLKHEENKPGEALKLITTAIEKNDNRAVYRSRMLLDSDAAARSANLSSVYSELGFSSTAKNVASSAVTNNSRDFANHHALVTAYSGDSKARVLRAREAFIARLLAPIGARELNVGSTETDIQTYPWISPGIVGANEYSSLFAKRGLRGDFKSFQGSQESRGYDWQLQAIGNRVSVSGGQYDFKTEGYRANNDLDMRISEAVIHLEATDRLKLLASGYQRAEAGGDLINAMDSDLFNSTLRREREIDGFTLGATFDISNKSRFLAYAAQADADIRQSQSVVLPNIVIQSRIIGKSKLQNSGFQVNTSYQQSNISIGYDQEKYLLESAPMLPTNPPLQVSQDAALEKLYFDLSSQIHRSVKTEIGLGHSEWSNRPEITGTLGSRLEHRIGLTIKPRSHMELSLANWKSISNFLPTSTKLEKQLVSGLNISDTTSGFTPITATAGKLSWKDGNKFFGILAHRKNYTQAFSLNQVIYGNEIKENAVYIDLEFLPHEKLSVALHAEYEQNKRQENNAFTVATIPSSLYNRNLLLSTKFLVTGSLQIETQLEYLSQKSFNLDPSTTNDDHISFLKREDDGILVNLKAKYDLEKFTGGIKIEWLNISDQKISIYGNKIQDRIGSLLLSTSQIPHRRSLLATFYFNF